MATTNKIFLFIFAIILVSSCTVDKPETTQITDGHTLIYQDLINMEYALLTQDYKSAEFYSDNLDTHLKDGYKLYCPDESAQIDGARLTNKIFAQHLEEKNLETLLDDLRILKGTVVSLVSDDDYDPFLAFLWRFEEDMYYATETAMDPMLDKYDWNEFKLMVDCMNDSWYPLQLHYPSPEILDHDEERFKNQTKYKIYLQKAIEKFNAAVETADYSKNPICEPAEDIRKAYLAYINTFIIRDTGKQDFMATL